MIYAPAKSAGSRQAFELAMPSPALLLLVAISFIPFFYIIWMSLNQVGLIGGMSFEFTGLAN